MILDVEQRKHIFENGYVVVPGVVPPDLIEQALKFINHSIRTPGAFNGPCSDQAITDLFNKTAAKQLAESVIGESMLRPVGSAKVALRYPVYDDPTPSPHPHLDGVLKLAEGEVQSFTALVGILLSDLPTVNAGNFTVWPGTHLSYEQYFKEHGPEVLLTEEAFRTAHRSPNVPLPEPHQITGKAGDMILAHYQLIHAAGINVWHHIRYACYFRIDHIDRRKDWKSPLTDMWLHWPGIRAVN